MQQRNAQTPKRPNAETMDRQEFGAGCFGMSAFWRFGVSAFQRFPLSAFRLFGVFAFLLACAAMSSCNIVTPVAYAVMGPDKVSAEYTLADVPTVVYIDDRQNVVNPVSLRRVIADAACQDLMAHKCLGPNNTISGQDAMMLVAQKERNSHIMSIEDIGKTVGAKQVIFVEMTGFSDTPDGVTPRPNSSFRVRVIDVDARKRVFPPGESSESARVLQASTGDVDLEKLRNTATRTELFQLLAKQTGIGVAKLFYRHEARQLGSTLHDRSLNN
jgi:hypothetical protein